MKTIFKEGMEVYDQIYEPDVKGKVLDVNMQISPHPITVKFGSCVRYYTAEGCRGRNQIRTLSTSPYTLQGFEQKELIPTYEEVIKGKNYFYLPEYLVAPNKELAVATVALLKLLFLRDYYNEGWQPDWKSTEELKYYIKNYIDEFLIKKTHIFIYPLVFKSEKIALKFLEEQRELLEIAKPLL